MMKAILNKYIPDRKNLIFILQEVQDKFGYVGKEMIEDIARFLNVPPSEIFSIVSFYNKFRSKPVGKYPITVCLGTACYLMGGEIILNEFERELNIKCGDITEDGLFSIDKAACFGCCTQAPVVNIGGKIHPRVTPAKVEEILVNLKDEINKNKT